MTQPFTPETLTEKLAKAWRGTSRDNGYGDFIGSGKEQEAHAVATLVVGYLEDEATERALGAVAAFLATAVPHDLGLDVQAALDELADFVLFS